MSTNDSTPDPTAGERGITVPAHHVVGMGLGFTCTNCGGHTTITPLSDLPCVNTQRVVERIKADAEAKARADERERIAQAIEDLPTCYVHGEGGGWLHAVRTHDAIAAVRGDA